jgi:hypothetical protein
MESSSSIDLSVLVVAFGTGIKLEAGTLSYLAL